MSHLRETIGKRMPLALFVVVVLSFLQNVSAFDCELGGNQNFVDKLRVLDPKSCPTVLDSSDKIFCCTERNTGINVCCNASEFITTDFAIMVGVGIIVGILISCFLCCCCCPCCILYKRRSTPGTVVMVQRPYEPVPTQATYVVHQSVPVGYQHTQGYPQPPPYSAAPARDAYTKQAPYNPHF